MKWLIKLIILIIAAFGVVSMLHIYQGSNLPNEITSKLSKQITKNYKKFARNSCDTPLVYTLGNIDPRFNLSNVEIIEFLSEAEDVWESESGKDLFVFKQNAEDAVVVNFIFDERQAQIFASRTSESILENKWDTYNELVGVYDKLIDKYEESLLKYNRNVSLYEKRLDNFNRIVDEWNENPGSKEEYKKLKDEDNNIQNQYKSLEDERIILNNSLDNLNQLSEEIKIINNQLNIETDIHNAQFATEDVVDAGDYRFYKINIYQFSTTAGLKLTLAHEMGHALGLDHVEDTKSIMNYLFEEQDVLNLHLGEGDVQALIELCNN